MGKGISNVREDLSGVSFVNEKLGFAVGANGMIIRSASAGAYWEVMESGLACGSKT